VGADVGAQESGREETVQLELPSRAPSSSPVRYGATALSAATAVKLARALWNPGAGTLASDHLAFGAG